MTGIKKNREFGEVYRRGKSAADRYLVLYVMANGTEESRIGISVSKKVGNSVVRHRIKRRLREIARLDEASLPKQADMVVIARKPGAEADYHTLRHSFLKLGKKFL